MPFPLDSFFFLPAHPLVLMFFQEKNKTRLLKQFHFKAWPDHGVPANATELLDFRDKVLKYGSNLAGPIVVHCRYGVALVQKKIQPSLIGNKTRSQRQGLETKNLFQTDTKNGE